MELSLKGRTALVTGGGKGIGAGISKALAASGAKVLFNYNSNPEMAFQTVEHIRQAGGEAFAMPTDVSDRLQVDAMIQKAVELFGGIDILVNNAAWQPNLDIDEYTPEDYDRIMATNLGGYFRCMQASLPYLKLSGQGRVINISSVHGKRPTDFDVCYSMCKGGIKMLTREAAIEFKKYHITVNAILPGAIRIEYKSGWTQPIKFKKVERERDYEHLFPFGLPEDIANLVVYLASDQASHLTGAGIRADGGAMLI